MVTLSISGLSTNLILRHVPGLIGDAQPQNRLLGLSDARHRLAAILGYTALSAPLIVSPTGGQFKAQCHSSIIKTTIRSSIRINWSQAHRSGASTCKLSREYQAPSYECSFGCESTWVRVYASFGGAYTSAPGVGAEYVMAFQPIASPGALLWSKQYINVPASYLAAWNFAPSSETALPIKSRA